MIVVSLLPCSLMIKVCRLASSSSVYALLMLACSPEQQLDRRPQRR